MENRLGEFRLKRGWTQQQLADRVGVYRQTIISIERGRYNPSILLAFRLAREFDLTIEDLFLFSEEKENKNAQKK